MGGALHAHEPGHRHRRRKVCRAVVAGRREHVRPRDCMMETADSSEIVTCMNAQCGQQLRIPAGEILQVTCPTCRASFTHKPERVAGMAEDPQGLSPEYQRKAWALAETLLGIAQESVTLVKRQAPAVAGKLSRKQE